MLTIPPCSSLLGVFVSPRLASGVPLVKWVEAPGSHSEMYRVNFAEANARVRGARRVSHIKEHRVAGSTLG